MSKEKYSSHFDVALPVIIGNTQYVLKFDGYQDMTKIKTQGKIDLEYMAKMAILNNLTGKNIKEVFDSLSLTEEDFEYLKSKNKNYTKEYLNELKENPNKELRRKKVVEEILTHKLAKSLEVINGVSLLSLEIEKMEQFLL